MEFTAYIIYSSKNSRYYIGHTNNLERRLRQHNNDEYSWTRAHRPWQLIYKSMHRTRVEAMKEEKYIKSLKNKERIQEYIKRNNLLRVN